MADVFISYAHENRDVARELAARLTRAGFTAWWDREIAIGADLTRVIEDQLEHAAAVMVVWSRASVRSSWVMGEANVGFEANKLIPLQIDDAGIPLPFRGCETADMRDWPAQNHELQIQKLLTSIRALVTGEGVDEQAASESNDQLDPTVSVRIAARVSEALQQVKPGDSSDQLALRLEFETALADIALEAVSGSLDKRGLSDFLSKLEPMLRTSFVNSWHGHEQLYGWDLRGKELADTLGDADTLFLCPNSTANHAPSHSAFLDEYNLNWVYLCRQGAVTLTIGSMYSDPPPGEIADRLSRVAALVRGVCPVSGIDGAPG